MGGIAESVFFDTNNNKVHDDGLQDDRAPEVEVVHYLNKLATRVMYAQLNSRDKFEAGRQPSMFPSAPSYLDLAAHTDFTTARSLVSFEYDGAGVIFTAKKIGPPGWLPKFTVGGGAPLVVNDNVLVIERGKNTYITCVLMEGEDGDCTYDFIFTWPKRMLERNETKFFPAAPSSKDDEKDDEKHDEKKEERTLPYTPADKLDSEATTPRDAGAGASKFQWKFETTPVAEGSWLSGFKAYVTDPLNQGAVAQWQEDAQTYAGGAENKRTFQGKCLAFVMKSFKTAMTDAAVKAAVEARMDVHNKNLKKPPTKKEKKEAAEAEKPKSKKANKSPRKPAAAGSKRKPASKKRKAETKTKKRKAEASDSSKSSDSSESYKDSSETE